MSLSYRCDLDGLREGDGGGSGGRDAGSCSATLLAG